MSQKEEAITNWIEDGKALLSSLMNHDNAKPLIDSFYDNNTNSNNNPVSIVKKLHFKQIENDLLNSNYASINALFGDISILFDNAMKIFNNAQNIMEINEIFIKYKNSYQNGTKYKENMEIEQESEQQQEEEEESNDNTDSTENNGSIESETDDMNATKVTFKQRRKTRMHTNLVTTTTTRRRSARLAKLKNNDHDSDDNDIDIYIGINVKNTKQKRNKMKKRIFSTMNNELSANNNNNNNNNNHNNNDHDKQNKIARISTTHSSPNHMVSTEDIKTNQIEVTTKKRNRRSRRKKTNKNTTTINTEINENVNNENDDDDDDGNNKQSNSKTNDININITENNDNNDDDDDDDDEDDVDMKRGNNVSSLKCESETLFDGEIENKYKYNLRSKSKIKAKLTKCATSPTPKIRSLSPSKSHSKTPIAPKMTAPITRSHKKIKKMIKPKLESNKTLINNNNNNNNNNEDPSIDNEYVINFDDGTESSLCGKFDVITNMRYSCRGLCINGDFKPFNQDWISLDRFDQFKNELAVIFCGVYDGHGILGHNSSKYCARHLPKEFIFELYEIHNNIKSKYNQHDITNRISSIPSDTATLSYSVDDEEEEEEDVDKEEDTKKDNKDKDKESDDMNPILLALHNALNKIDCNLREISNNESTMFSTILTRNGCESRLIDYGTTVNCLVSDGYDVFILNVGDSRCLLIEANNNGILTYKQITSDHNPFLRIDEQERVKNSNGQFFKHGEELRLYPQNSTFKEARRKGLAINMTRAIGHSTLSKYGLISKPESYHIKLKQNHQYIFIMASDGIWDILTNKEIFESVQSIYSSFIHNQTNQTIEDEIAMEILETAEKKWRKKRVGDNISVVVTRIVKNH